MMCTGASFLFLRRQGVCRNAARTGNPHFISPMPLAHYGTDYFHYVHCAILALNSVNPYPAPSPDRPNWMYLPLPVPLSPLRNEKKSTSTEESVTCLRRVKTWSVAFSRRTQKIALQPARCCPTPGSTPSCLAPGCLSVKQRALLPLPPPPPRPPRPRPRRCHRLGAATATRRSPRSARQGNVSTSVRMARREGR